MKQDIKWYNKLIYEIINRNGLDIWPLVLKF